MKKGFPMIYGLSSLGCVRRFARVQVLTAAALALTAMPTWVAADDSTPDQPIERLDTASLPIERLGILTDAPSDAPTQPTDVPTQSINAPVQPTEQPEIPSEPIERLGPPSSAALPQTDSTGVPQADSTSAPQTDVTDDATPAAPAITDLKLPEIVQAQFRDAMKTAAEAAQSLLAAACDAASSDDADIKTEAQPVPASATVPSAAVSPQDKSASEQNLPDQTNQAEIETLTAQIEEEKTRSAHRIAELEQLLAQARQGLAAIDQDGFIHGWLVLGPIPLDAKVANNDEESNKEYLDRQFVAAEAMPRHGDAATIDDMALTWKSVRPTDFYVDLAAFANDQEQDPEHAAYLGVTYVTCDKEINNVKLAIGSDDGSVWSLNGKEVIRSYEGRGVDKDQNTADDLTLKPGVNVLRFTVLNGVGECAAAARFLDASGNPITGLKISLTPPAQQVTQSDDGVQPSGEQLAQ